MVVKWMAALGEFEGRNIPQSLSKASVESLFDAIENPDPIRLTLKRQEASEEVLEVCDDRTLFQT